MSQLPDWAVSKIVSDAGASFRNVADHLMSQLGSGGILADHYPRINEAISIITEEVKAPHVLMRPSLFIDGNMWCALYGENIQDGVAGFGASPSAACADFDSNWYKSLVPAKQALAARKDGVA